MANSEPDDRISNAEDENELLYPLSVGSLLTESISQPFRNYCEACDTVYDDLNEFEYHSVQCHKPKIFVCHVCKQTFARRYHLQRHMRYIHDAKTHSKCPVCAVELPRKDIAKHIKTEHSRKRIFKCRECDFQGNTLKEFLVHNVNHMDRHNCPHCDLSYKRRDHMTRHIKTEHMKMSINCPVCNNMYKRRDHMLRHMREKHNKSTL